MHRRFAVLAFLLTITAPAWADPLDEGFADPPASARPRVWWHWMNGNVSKDGIAKDLQWMKRSGIGGLQNFDANLVTPQVVEKRLAYMTPEWKDAFRFAAKTADELGLELAIAGSPGWSETGGPWVKAQDGMKKLVWSHVDVDGSTGRSARPTPALQLPAPPDVAGPYHDLPVDTETLAAFSGNKPYERPRHYQDVAVLAYPVTPAKPVAKPRSITSNGKALDVGALIDDSLTTIVEIDRATAQKPASLVIEFDAPQTVRSATFFLPGAISLGNTVTAHLEARTKGDQWREVAAGDAAEAPTTLSMKPVTASAFRVVLTPKAGSFELKPVPGADLSLLAKLMVPKPQKVAQLVLSGEPRVHEFEKKAGFALAPDYYPLEKTDLGDAGAVALDRVVDLTARMGKDGTLDWTPPAGHWRVVRLGYSLTGKTNHPATEEATGLEVDKYDARAVRDYFEHYLGMYRDTVGPDLMGKRGLQAIITDSVEVGPSNWTPGMLEHFKRLRGYDATRYLPALTGAIVGSRRQTDAFLYDWRRTLTELFASEHYGTVAAVAHEQGLKVYGEALEGGRVALGDDIQLRKYADYPMAALWAFRPGSGPRDSYRADMKTASSTAHLYGKAAVAAESMTSALAPWAHAPHDLRRIIDAEFAHGINLPVIHTSVHQPVDDKQPGLSLMIFGQFFTRHETWAEMARPWIDYLARNSFLLQQGRNVADVAYFYGEDASPTAIYPDVPKSYAYDFVNADAVLNLLKVEQGALVTPAGARYRALYLGGTSAKMTLPVLRRIAELAESGATVIGKAPEGSPALDAAGRAYATLTRKLWSGAASTTVGKGRVVATSDVEAALASTGLPPDFAYATEKPAEVLFVHRKLDGGDLYFVNNRQSEPVSIEARFRVTGRAPEIWRADTGAKQLVSYRTEDAVTVVPLQLDAEDSFFVVFRTPATAPSAEIQAPALASVMTIEGPWQVSFQEGRGAPGKLELPALASLSENTDPGVKYFSGTATYRKRFELAQPVAKGEPLLLDLGAVGDIAEVLVNGKSAGFAWHAPYRVDIGGLVKKGRNDLEIRVADLWVNRLIGDAQPDPAGRPSGRQDARKVTFTTIPTYRADAPLRPSGLIGPVQLLAPAADQGAAPAGISAAQLGPERCEALNGTRWGFATIEEAKPVERGERLFGFLKRLVIRIAAGSKIPPIRAPEDYCRATAKLRAVPGSEITAQVWLPQEWNGKLVALGGGGINGGLDSAPFLISLVPEKGYAVLATDAGHATTDSAKFAYESPEQYADYAYRANHLGAAFAKALIAGYYGTPAKRAYFNGCSNGGRDALMEASRYPDDYDGIIAGAPAASWSRLMASHGWFYQACRSAPGLAGKLKLAQDAVMKQCDERDGVKDQLLENPLECAFDPAELQCAAGAAKDCLTGEEVAALRRIYGGPRLSDGTPVYPGMARGGEPLEWTRWFCGEDGVGTDLSTQSFRWMAYGDPDWSFDGFDVDRDYPVAKERVAPVMDADDPDVSAFLQRGGKLMLYHGWNDAAIAPGATVDYYEAVREKLGQRAAAQVRLFMVPGMGHCGGGAGPNMFGKVEELDRWVETGTAPDRIVAREYDPPAFLVALPDSKLKRTRPLCAWPKTAHYTGAGSTDEAANFTCE